MSIKRLVRSFTTIAKSDNLSHTQRVVLFDQGCEEIMDYLEKGLVEEEDGIEMAERLLDFAELNSAASQQFNDARYSCLAHAVSPARVKLTFVLCLV